MQIPGFDKKTLSWKQISVFTTFCGSPKRQSAGDSSFWQKLPGGMKLRCHGLRFGSPKRQNTTNPRFVQNPFHRNQCRCHDFRRGSPKRQRAGESAFWQKLLRGIQRFVARTPALPLRWSQQRHHFRRSVHIAMPLFNQYVLHLP